MVINSTKINKKKEKLTSDDKQYHNFVDIGGIVDHHCLNFLLFC
jgi:hypothetical protein